MNGLGLLAVFVTAFYAYSVGRSVIFWTLMSIWYSWWIVLLLLVMPKREPKQFAFPRWFINIFGPRYIKRTINKMEEQF
jgi:hypothetical protein